MKSLTWPGVVVFVTVVVAVVALFAITDDAGMRERLLGFFDTFIPFVIGGGMGAVTGGILGLARGKNLI